MNKYKIFYPGAGRDFFAWEINDANNNNENPMLSSSSGVGFFSILLEHLRDFGYNRYHNFLPRMMNSNDNEENLGGFIDIVFCDNGHLDFDKLSYLAISKLIEELDHKSKYKVKNLFKSKGAIRYTKSLDCTPSIGHFFFSEHAFDYKNISVRFRFFECSWEHSISYLRHVGWTLDNDDSLILDSNFNGGEGSHSFGSYLHDVLYYDRDEFIKSDWINIVFHRSRRNDSERVTRRLDFLRDLNFEYPSIRNHGIRIFEE
jgi:hypothetical protein